MLAMNGGRSIQLCLPAADDDVMPDTCWGRFDELFTPAYWRGQAWQHEGSGAYEPARLGLNLAEEVSACLLGGYGIPAELGIAAFHRLRDIGLLQGKPEAHDLEAALSMPLPMGSGLRRYRFARSKAACLAGALRGLSNVDPALPDRELRDSLVSLPGIGPKTASWVVRNMRCSDQVAIIDIHIARAGRIAGFFSQAWDPARHYTAMEDAFLRFAGAIEVRASVLDNLMWDHMRRLGDLAREDEATMQQPGYGATTSIPIMAVPQATMRSSPGNSPVAISVPSKPRGQKPRPAAPAQRCSVARSAPASRQSRLPGFA